MGTKVKLKDIFGALDLADDHFSSYLDKKTGQITTIPNEAFSIARGEKVTMTEVEIHDSDIEFAKKLIAEELEDKKRYIALPSQFDIHEWDIMRRFSLSREDEEISQQLLNAIHGSGAFRYFKDTIYRLSIRQDWFDFRERALYEMARKWCRVNNIEFVEE